MIEVFIHRNIQMEVSRKGGTPSHHPFIVGIFMDFPRNKLNKPTRDKGDPGGSPIHGTQIGFV